MTPGEDPEEEISEEMAEILLDREGRYMQEIEIDCTTCIHRDSQGSLTCKAFPKGIPIGILSGYPHQIPFEGDNGILYVRDAAKA